MVGAIGGAVVGILISLLELFASKEKRIRQVQGLVQEEIEVAWSEARQALKAERKPLFAPVRQQIDEVVSARVLQLEESLERPLKIIKQQMTLMNRTKDQLEKMPYGTIQAI